MRSFVLASSTKQLTLPSPEGKHLGFPAYRIFKWGHCKQPWSHLVLLKLWQSAVVSSHKSLWDLFWPGENDYNLFRTAVLGLQGSGWVARSKANWTGHEKLLAVMDKMRNRHKLLTVPRGRVHFHRWWGGWCESHLNLQTKQGECWGLAGDSNCQGDKKDVLSHHLSPSQLMMRLRKCPSAAPRDVPSSWASTSSTWELHG